MRELLSTSINNLISVLVADNLTAEQKKKIMEAIGTLQGVMIIEDRIARKYDSMPDKQEALTKLNSHE